jgi:hypothetical protein
MTTKYWLIGCRWWRSRARRRRRRGVVDRLRGDAEAGGRRPVDHEVGRQAVVLGVAVTSVSWWMPFIVLSSFGPQWLSSSRLSLWIVYWYWAALCGRRSARPARPAGHSVARAPPRASGRSRLMIWSAVTLRARLQRLEGDEDAARVGRRAAAAAGEGRSRCRRRGPSARSRHELPGSLLHRLERDVLVRDDAAVQAARVLLRERILRDDDDIQVDVQGQGPDRDQEHSRTSARAPRPGCARRRQGSS